MVYRDLPTIWYIQKQKLVKNVWRQFEYTRSLMQLLPLFTPFNIRMYGDPLYSKNICRLFIYTCSYEITRTLFKKKRVIKTEYIFLHPSS